MDPIDDIEVIELNGDLDNLVKEITAAYRQLGLGATYSIDNGSFVTGFEIHPSEKKIVLLTD